MSFYRKLVGQRLYLSPFDPADPSICVQWAAWMNDPDVAEHYGGAHHLVSAAAARETLAGLAGYRLAIVLNDGDRCIGHISLHDVDPLNRNAFLGVFIGEASERGKGYGAEAIRLMLGFGFGTLNLHNIMLSVHADNPAGMACYRKVGFREVGRRYEWVFKHGQYVDKLYMGILAREFTGTRG